MLLDYINQNLYTTPCYNCIIKLAVYRNTFPASYVIYPEGGDIQRFPGYDKNGFLHILL